MIRRALDFAVALVGLVLLAPWFVTCGVLVWLTSGPILIAEVRIGRHGRPFRVWKFRTMWTGDERRSMLLRDRQADGPAFKMTSDPRITPVGRFLRKFCLDELPLLFSVLRGDMTLVGPAPVPFAWRDAEWHSDEEREWLRVRATAKPGLTCRWAIYGSGRMPFRDWVRIDLEDAARSLPWRDVALLAHAFARFLVMLSAATVAGVTLMVAVPFKFFWGLVVVSAGTLGGMLRSRSGAGEEQEVRGVRGARTTAARYRRVASLFAFVLPRKVREDLFEPSLEDLLHDWASHRRTHRGVWAWRWLHAVFVLKLAWLTIESVRAATWSLVVAYLTPWRRPRS
ncbi:MAG: sugar transferase [Planctomycetota bacterium]